MKQVISITKQHLREGEPGNADCCPASLALADFGFSRPSVYPATICWDRDGKLVQVPTPKVLKDFLVRYDDPVSDDPKISGWNLDMFEPFDFEIDTDQAK